VEYIVVGLAAMAISALVLYSGFGLGTLLMPVFAIFFPVPVAVASTAVVHLANNVFRIGFVGRNADWRVTIIFGLPAALFAVGGALILSWTSALEALTTYELGGREFSITSVKLVVAALIGGFAALELTPVFASLQFGRRYLALGGALSGFFGGLSGHQGALRSAFLAGVGLNATAFVGTASIAALLVDAVRLTVYGTTIFSGRFSEALGEGSAGVVAVAIGAAFVGNLLASRFLNGITMHAIRRLVGVLLAVLAVALATGIV
jgi:uncharacterized membrane protein YfcA